VREKTVWNLFTLKLPERARNLTVRVFIDKPGGVTHEDCAAVSRQLDAILDAEDFYCLDVFA
jgi:ribosome maturation factor RimP